MKRIFAFGCSMTKYYWPSWADIYAHDAISKDNTVEYYNYAGQGLGNIAIQTLLLEADLRHKFTKEDEILCMWSGWNRHDMYLKEIGWTRGRGSVIHGHFPYDNDYILRFWNEDNDYIKNSTAIIYANKLYDFKIQGTMVRPFFEEGSDGNMYIKRRNKICDFYYEHLPELYWWKKQYNDRDYFKLFKDRHPEVIDHLELLTNELGIKLSSDTIDYFTKMHNDILTNTDISVKIELSKYLESNYQEWNRGIDGDRL